MGAFIRGLLTGVAYVAPLGVQNLFVMNTVIKEDTKKALYTVIITSIMDISLALCSYFGLGLIIERYKIVRQILLLFGSIAVFIIGVKLFKSDVDIDDGVYVSSSYKMILLRTFSVTWLNPQAIIDGALLLGSARSLYYGANANFFIMGVNTASIIWFFTLFLTFRLLKDKIDKNILKFINILSGVIIIFFSINLFRNFLGEIM